MPLVYSKELVGKVTSGAAKLTEVTGSPLATVFKIYNSTISLHTSSSVALAKRDDL